MTPLRHMVREWLDDGGVGDRWGVDGPPPAAYGRVTDPGRYAVLHASGRAVLEELAGLTT